MTRYRIVEYKDGEGKSTYCGQKYICFGIWWKVKDDRGYKIDVREYSTALNKINALIREEIKSKTTKHKTYKNLYSGKIPEHIPEQQKEEYLKTFGEGKKYEE